MSVAAPAPCAVCALPAIEVRDSPGRGRGVFATRDIHARTLVETSHVLVFEARSFEAHGQYTALAHYTFHWRDSSGVRGQALALGLGSIFNHHHTPNVGFICDPSCSVIRFTTLRDVALGEELFISYGNHGLWFATTTERPPDSDEDDAAAAVEVFARLAVDEE